MNNRGPWCKCFDISGLLIYDEDLMVYHDHKVCTECKYDSHCRLFSPNSYCKHDVKLDVRGEKYRMGNPI